MFDEVVLETETGRVGGLYSSTGSKLEVVFEPGGEPVQRVRGKSYQTIKFPSVTFLRRVSPEHWHKLWVEKPEYVLHLALDSLAPEKRTLREAGMLLRQDPSALEADAKKLTPLFKKLEAEGHIELLGSVPEKIYTLVKRPEVNVPDAFQWLLGGFYEDATSTNPSSTGDKALSAKSKDVAIESIENNSGANDSKMDSKDQTLTIRDYLEALADDKAPCPPDFEDWVARPFDRALEISTSGTLEFKVKLKHPRASGYSLTSLLPSKIWDASKDSVGKLTKLKSAALHRTIATNWERDWNLLPHLKEIAEFDGDIGKGVSAAELLKVLAAISKAELRDSNLGKRTLDALLKDTKSLTALNAERKNSSKEAVSHMIDSALLGFSPGAMRDHLLLKSITKWGEMPRPNSIAEYSLTQLQSLLHEFEGILGGRLSARKDPAYVPLMDAVSKVANECLQIPGDAESVSAALSLQADYVLDLDAERLGKFLMSSFARIERLEPVARALSGVSKLKETQLQKEELESQVASQSEQIKHLREDLENASAELASLRKRALDDRKTQIQSGKDLSLESALPALKLLARSLSAAHEFLGDNVGAIGRFEILGDQAGLIPLGAPGQTVTFEPKLHNDPESLATPGDTVEIHNVGFKLETGGESIVVMKALVTKK